MFRNVVSTQDLLSDSQRSNYSSDSALFSLSQRQNSQNEFSQVRTQDLFTQNQTQGSQSESSFPHTKRMNTYDKWMSKGALHSKSSGPNHLSGQQQYQMNQNKLKETDYRELLQQVVSIVQDCNKEVKCTLTAVKERLASQSEISGEKLHDTVKAFLEDIWKHEDRILKAVQERNQDKEKVHELEQQLATATIQHKENIHELEKQLALKEMELRQLRQSQQKERGKPEDLKEIAKAIRQEMLPPQLTVENKLMEILQVTREASKQQIKQLDQYKQQMTTHAKQHNEWKTFVQRLIKDMEKRLQKDITTVGRNLKQREQEWLENLQGQVSETRTACLHDMQKLIEHALSQSTIDSSLKGLDRAVVTSIVDSMKKEWQTAVQKQTKSMEKKIQEMIKSQLRRQQQHLQNVHKTLLTDMTKRVELVAEQCQMKENEPSITPLTLPVFEEKFDEYHADLKHRLEEMHKKHIEEVQRIQQEIKLFDTSAHNPACESLSVSTIPKVMASNSFTSGQGHIPKTTGYQLQLKDSVLISPMSHLDRFNLFSKEKPSTPAAALSGPFTQTSLTSVRSSDSDNDVIFQQCSYEPEVPPDKTRFSKKRKKSNWECGKKAERKKAKDQVHSKSVADEPHQKVFIKTKAPRSTKIVEQMRIVDFSQEKSPDKTEWCFGSLQVHKSHHKRNQFCSPDASTISCCSSPAVSVTVDSELVMVRRSRWQTPNSPKWLSDRAFHSLDILGTPVLTNTMLQRSLPQQSQEQSCIPDEPSVLSPQLPRTQSQRKRIL